MQPVSSRIWTRAAVSISYGDNHYTMMHISLYATFFINVKGNQPRAGFELACKIIITSYLSLEEILTELNGGKCFFKTTCRMPTNKYW